MKKLFLLLSMSTAAVAAAPSIGSAKLVLDLPPILAGKTTSSGCTSDAACGVGNYCCDGVCQSTACSSSGCTTNEQCGTGYCCNSKCQTATCGTVPTARLNDTGIRWSGDLTTNNSTTCSDANQDCSYGRDKNDNSSLDGHAGFSFTKLNSTGVELLANAPSWACVQDNVTRLIWEHNSNTAPIKLPWYNNDNNTNGGNAGLSNGNVNTQAYAAAANTKSLCGKSTGWRVPTIKELVSLINSSKMIDSISSGMAVDEKYFPNINDSNKFFWSSTPVASDPVYAWGVDFAVGLTDSTYMKTNTNNQSIMLVRTMD